jgi:hypothetical protein
MVTTSKPNFCKIKAPIYGAPNIWENQNQQLSIIHKSPEFPPLIAPH